MNKCKLYFALLLMCFSTKVSAQIKGMVVNENGTPVEFANVSLLKAKDSTFVAGVATLADGKFSFAKAIVGASYILKVSSIGYNNTFVSCISPTNLSPIHLKPVSIDLQGVEIKGNRPFLKQADEGIEVNVEGTVLSRVGTANDVLAYVPGLMKEENKYKVPGKNNIKFFFGRREIRNLSELELLKSEDIKSVTLIKNPGSSYGADVDAVIKIITLKRKGEGLGLDAKAIYGQGNYAYTKGEFNTNYRYNGLDFFASAWVDNDVKKIELSDETTSYTQNIWKIISHTNSLTKEKNGEFSAGFNYEINAENSIGAKYSYDFSPYCRDITTAETTELKDNNKIDYINTNSVMSMSHNPQHETNVYYDGAVGKWSLSFNGDYMNTQNSNTELIKEYTQTATNRTVHATYNEHNKLWAGNMNMGHTFLWGNFDFGAEYTHTTRQSTYYNPEGFVPSSSIKIVYQSFAPYAEYSQNIGAGQLNVGLRFEHVKYDYELNGIHINEQSRQFNNWFPSAQYSVQIGNVQMQLGYTVKTLRPTYKQLGNTYTYINRYQLQTGNPMLGNATKHNVSLSGVWKMLQFSIDYLDQRNAIFNWGDIDEKNPAISVMTFKAVKSMKQFIPTIVMAPTFGIWHPVLSFTLLKQWITPGEGIIIQTNNKPLGLLNFTNIFAFNDTFTAEAGVYYQSKGNAENVTFNHSITTVNAGITKTFFHDTFSVKLSVEDLLRNHKQDLSTHFTNLTLWDKSITNTRRVMLTARFKFNTVSSKYKGEGAGEEEKARF